MREILPMGCPARCGLLLGILATTLLSAALADDTGADGAWEMSDLTLKLRAKNTTSAYSIPVTREMQTLLLNTVDPEKPGVAFRCEKGKLYVVLAVRPADLVKALREGVRRLRDWELTYRIADGDAVTGNWVSMNNSRLFMAHDFASTAAIFRAARDGQPLEVTVKGWDPVSIDMPESDDELFEYYIESCRLDPDYDPHAA